MKGVPGVMVLESNVSARSLRGIWKRFKKGQAGGEGGVGGASDSKCELLLCVGRDPKHGGVARLGAAVRDLETVQAFGGMGRIGGRGAARAEMAPTKPANQPRKQPISTKPANQPSQFCLQATKRPCNQP